MRSIISSTLAAAIALVAVPALACDGPGKGEKSAQRAEIRAEALSQADADGNGSLSVEEFETFKEAMHKARAERMFAKLDADGDGQVTVEELDQGRGRH